jgi:hypothetical protein
MNDAYLTPLIFIIAGCGVLGLYFYLSAKRNRMLSAGVPVEGIVFDFVSRSVNNSSGNYPQIRFLTLKQEWVTVTYNVSYPGFILKRGQRVDVYYNQDKPSEFILKMKADKWLLLIILVSSILCLAWGGISLIKAYTFT